MLQLSARKYTIKYGYTLASVYQSFVCIPGFAIIQPLQIERDKNNTLTFQN